MAPKKSAAAAAAAQAATPESNAGVYAQATAPARTAANNSSSTKATSSSASSSSPQRLDQIALSIWSYYQKNTPQRTKLIDVFLGFLALVGALQFAYCILAGNFPFNAFLSGFGVCVGQFVLTVSLRIQTTEANKSEFPAVSPERAFTDFVVGSLILHFFCVNFIN